MNPKTIALALVALATLGFALVVVGAAMVSVPAAFVAGGLGLAGVSLAVLWGVDV